MNKEFYKVLEKAEAIKKAIPEERAEYVAIIEDAKKEQAIAEQAKEAAQDVKSFNKACDDLTHAREREAHFKQLLDQIDGKQRMDTAEYYRQTDAINNVVVAAADNFRRVADKVMDDLARARAEYEALTADADRVLIALDDAAQVLQNEYKFRTLTFINKPDEQVADPEYWKRHAIRYNNFGGYAGSMAERLIIYADPDTMTGRSEKALTAWKAAGRALNN